MDRDRDEELLRGRAYGTNFDDPHPSPRPGRTYAELVGGPLDSLLLDTTGWTPQDIATGAALMTEIGQFGAGGRALHGPRPGDAGRCDWGGDVPGDGGPPRRTQRLRHGTIPCHYSHQRRKGQ